MFAKSAPADGVRVLNICQEAEVALVVDRGRLSDVLAVKLSANPSQLPEKPGSDADLAMGNVWPSFHNRLVRSKRTHSLRYITADYLNDRNANAAAQSSGRRQNDANPSVALDRRMEYTFRERHGWNTRYGIQEGKTS